MINFFQLLFFNFILSKSILFLRLIFVSNFTFLIFKTQILFLFGFGCLSGWSRTVQFFTSRLRMSLVFIASMSIILFTRHTFVGMLLELFSFVMLFHNFLPMILSWARNMPYIGPLTNLPGIKQCLDKIANLKVTEKVEKMQTGSWA